MHLHLHLHLHPDLHLHLHLQLYPPTHTHTHTHTHTRVNTYMHMRMNVYINISTCTLCLGFRFRNIPGSLRMAATRAPWRPERGLSLGIVGPHLWVCLWDPFMIQGLEGDATGSTGYKPGYKYLPGPVSLQVSP